MPVPEENERLLEAARNEISGMAKDGLNHPSTKPVIAGAAIGVVVAAITPLSWPLGLVAGAGIALFTRIKK